MASQSRGLHPGAEAKNEVSPCPLGSSAVNGVRVHFGPAAQIPNGIPNDVATCLGRKTPSFHSQFFPRAEFQGSHSAGYESDGRSE